MPFVLNYSLRCAPRVSWVIRIMVLLSWGTNDHGWGRKNSNSPIHDPRDFKSLVNMKEIDSQKANVNPTAILATLISKREKLQEELRSIEKQVYELETNYLQDSSNFGHVLKGFDGFLSSSKTTTNIKRSRKFQPEDRLFSLSSVTSVVGEELGVRHEDGRSDFGIGRSKGGSLHFTVQGKPKKGRAATAPRDAKRARQSSEADFEDDDDPEVSLR